MSRQSMGLADVSAGKSCRLRLHTPQLQTWETFGCLILAKEGLNSKEETSSGTGVGGNNYFSLTLYRKNAIGATDCGRRTALRNGSSHFDWTNVGAGNYYFYFSKAYDGQVVNCDAMGMYSW